MSDDAETPESLLPYEGWTEDAMREVALCALEHVAATGEMPGEHHFYITFRTDQPGVRIPAHLKARYPQDMTIVLQHQFHDLTVDRAAGLFSVGLVFGGVASTLVVPFTAMTAFWDPHVRFGLRFRAAQPEAPAAAPAPLPPAAELADDAGLPDAAAAPGQVVSLDAFRRRPAKE